MSDFYSLISTKIGQRLEKNEGHYSLLSTDVRKVMPGMNLHNLLAVLDQMQVDGLIAGYASTITTFPSITSRPVKRLHIVQASHVDLLRTMTAIDTMMYPDEGSVYFMKPHARAGQGKVGYTNDVKRRFYAHYVAKSMDRVIVAHMDSPNAFQVEKVMIEALSDMASKHSARGTEWIQAPVGLAQDLDQIVLHVMDGAVKGLARLQPMDRHDPRKRSQLARRLRSQIQARFGVEA